jgi:hypothetical protein
MTSLPAALSMLFDVLSKVMRPVARGVVVWKVIDFQVLLQRHTVSEELLVE